MTHEQLQQIRSALSHSFTGPDDLVAKRDALAILDAALAAPETQPDTWDGAEEWERLAFELCADEHGEESCNELIWSDFEPWGERWLKYEDEAKRMISLVRKHTAPVAAPDTWTSVKDAMPQSGVTVLAYYKNRNGFERRIRAKWTATKTEEANAEYDWGEYDEETDTYWTPGGWYECIDNWDEFSSVMVSEGEITHWMPMPAAPDTRQAALEQVSRDCQMQAAMDDKRDAERWRYIAEHWETWRESYDKKGKLKSLTLLIQANFKGCSQEGLARIIDAAMKEKKA